MTQQFHAGQEVEVAKAWENCPSTHCERSQECRSPHECNGWRKARIVSPYAIPDGLPHDRLNEKFFAEVQFLDGTRAVFSAEHIRAVRGKFDEWPNPPESTASTEWSS